MSTISLLRDEVLQDDALQQIDLLNAKLDRVLQAVEQLDRRREELEDLVTDLMPAVNGALGVVTRQFDALQKDGTLDLLRSLAARAPDAMRTAHALSAPEITSLAQSAAAALANSRRGSPPGWRTLLRARKEPRVRRGVAALLDILRAVGEGSAARTEPRHAAVSMARASQPAARKAAPAASHRPAPQASPSAQVRQIAGVAVSTDAEGFVTDRNQWTRAIAEAIAVDVGIAPLTPAHWNVIEFCRNDAAQNGPAPGMRRITQQLGITAREMYALFPKGPGILAARIAGLGKPRSCV